MPWCLLKMQAPWGFIKPPALTPGAETEKLHFSKLPRGLPWVSTFASYCTHTAPACLAHRYLMDELGREGGRKEGMDWAHKSQFALCANVMSSSGFSFR